MFFPKLKAQSRQRRAVEQFAGLDRRPGSGAGCLREMENLWSGGYPALEVRPRRSVMAELTKPHAFLGREALVWVDGTGLYINGAKTAPVLSDGDKRLVCMGAYLLVWPDKVYINTQDFSDWGRLENTRQTSGEVTFALCDESGTALGEYTVRTYAPGEPETGDLWLDTSRPACVMRRYDGSAWLELEGVCTRISAANIGTGFSAGDGVTLSGCGSSELNGLHVLQAVGDNWIVVPALCRTLGSQTAVVTVMRTVQDMDFVVECGNRLWGCKYGIVDGQSVNAVYGSALGDFRNWNTFAGLSTDSYAANRGSDGVFTGAAAYLGTVLFFKENSMERLYISAAGAHQITSLQCPGVKQGSSRSLAVANGVLYFHGSGGVYAFDGSMPQLVSAAFGDKRYESAVGGAAEGHYWLSARRNGADHLFVYDTARKLWFRQDGLRVKQFALSGGVLYGLTTDGVTALQGGSEADETDIGWYAETGDLGLDTPEQKYLQRVELRLLPEYGAWVKAYVSYDEGRHWQYAGELKGEQRLRAGLLAVRPVRCPQLRLRLEGHGNCRIYSVSAVYEKGSDLP